MIVSKQELTQLVKEELARVLKEVAAPLSEDSEIRQAIDELYLIIEGIAWTYKNLKTNKAKEIFEKYLVENIDMYVKTWRKEREGTNEVDPLMPQG
jgi:hypothetical protein